MKTITSNYNKDEVGSRKDYLRHLYFLNLDSKELNDVLLENDQGEQNGQRRAFAGVMKC